MPGHNSIAATDNKPLAEFRKFKLKYGGVLSGATLGCALNELQDIVPRGRYTGRNGEQAVCVSTFERSRSAQSIDEIHVVYGPVTGGTDQRISIAIFLETYRFFATDCA